MLPAGEMVPIVQLKVTPAVGELKLMAVLLPEQIAAGLNGFTVGFGFTVTVISCAVPAQVPNVAVTL